MTARWDAAPERWSCCCCGAAVGGDDGCMELADGGSGGYPGASPLRERQQEAMDRHAQQEATNGGSAPGAFPRSISLAVMIDVHAAAGPPMTVRFRHWECPRDEDEAAGWREGYCVPLNEIRTASELLEWLAHLSGKVWIGAHEIRQIIGTWGNRAPGRDPTQATPAITVADVRRARARLVSSATRALVFERDGFRCRRCGHGAPDARLVIDHITPVALGGSGEMANLQTLCWPCNAGKLDRPPHAHDVLS